MSLGKIVRYVSITFERMVRHISWAKVRHVFIALGEKGKEYIHVS